MVTAAATADPIPIDDDIICIHCTKSRFPDPKEQCYKFGGLICTVDDTNVEKYQKCKFPPGTAIRR